MDVAPELRLGADGEHRRQTEPTGAPEPTERGERE
jgi:hypothetical protein